MSCKVSEFSNHENFHTTKILFYFKMSPYIAYFLGLLTLLIIIIPFWIASMRFQNVARGYRTIMCNQALP